MDKNRLVKKNLFNKILIIIISLLLCILINPIIYANSEEEQEDYNFYQNILQEIEKENTLNANSNNISSNDTKNTTEVANKEIKKPVINSRRYAVYDRASKTVIYGKDEDKQTAMASTTKIMTSLVVLENCKNLNDTITVDKKSAQTGGSTLGIKEGDKITVNDLLYGLMLRSGNDAAVALAEYIGGSVEGFAKMMNEKAREIGLENTNFVTPNGLDDPNHYTTATELAKLTDVALNNEKFAEIVKTKYKTISINGSSREIKNTNELLLADVEGIYGVKTGFTNNAGRCLVTAVKRNDMDLIFVVLGADTREDRAKDSLKLINYAYQKYKVENVEEFAQKEFEMWKNVNQNRIYINKGRGGLEIEISKNEIQKIVTDKSLSAEINVLGVLEAPVEKGTKIGSMIIKNGEDIIEQLDVIVSKKLERRNLLDYFYIFAKLTK